MNDMNERRRAASSDTFLRREGPLTGRSPSCCCCCCSSSSYCCAVMLSSSSCKTGGGGSMRTTDFLDLDDCCDGRRCSESILDRLELVSRCRCQWRARSYCIQALVWGAFDCGGEVRRGCSCRQCCPERSLLSGSSLSSGRQRMKSNLTTTRETMQRAEPTRFALETPSHGAWLLSALVLTFRP